MSQAQWVVVLLVSALLFGSGCGDDGPTNAGDTDVAEQTFSVGHAGAQIELPDVTTDVPANVFRSGSELTLSTSASPSQNPPPAGYSLLGKAVSIRFDAADLPVTSNAQILDRMVSMTLPLSWVPSAQARFTVEMPGHPPVLLFGRTFPDTLRGDQVSFRIPASFYARLAQQTGTIKIEAQVVTPATGKYRAAAPMTLYHVTGGIDPVFASVDDLVQIPAGKYPLLLIHGWDKAWSNQQSNSDQISKVKEYWLDALRFFRAEAADVFEIYCLFYDEDEPLDDIGDDLDALVDARFGAAQEGRLHVLAHSMGGLVTRTWTVGWWGGNKYLAKAVFIDTPHHGSSLANAYFCGFHVADLFAGDNGAQNLIYDSELPGDFDYILPNTYLQQLNAEDTYWDRYVMCYGYLDPPGLIGWIEQELIDTMHDVTWFENVPSDCVIECESQLPAEHPRAIHAHPWEHNQAKSAESVLQFAMAELLPNAVPPAEDTTPPAAVTQLIAQAVGQTSAALQWPAPGDDGSLGQAFGYDIRYSTELVTDANWNTAIEVSGEPAPAIAGTTQNLTIAGLQPGGVYCFALKAVDEVNNWSGLSNAACVTMPGGQPGEPQEWNPDALTVALWHFNEGSGTSAADASGHGHHGTLHGATWSSSGRFGRALSFDGTSAYVQCPSTPSLKLQPPLTLEAWVYLHNYGGSCLTKGTGMGTYSLKMLSGKICLDLNDHGSPGGPTVFGNSTIPLNTWTWIAVTYDGQKARFFLNGALDGERSLNAGLQQSDQPLYIGVDPPGNDEYFRGMIDEVRLSNTIRY